MIRGISDRRRDGLGVGVFAVRGRQSQEDFRFVMSGTSGETPGSRQFSTVPVLGVLHPLLHEQREHLLLAADGPLQRHPPQVRGHQLAEDVEVVETDHLRGSALFFVALGEGRGAVRMLLELLQIEGVELGLVRAALFLLVLVRLRRVARGIILRRRIGQS